MEIQIKREADRARVTVSGTITTATALALYEALVGLLPHDGVARLEVDLAGVTRVDASAVGVLAQVRQQALAMGKAMVVEGLLGEVRQTFALMPAPRAPGVGAGQGPWGAPASKWGSAQAALQTGASLFDFLVDAIFAVLGAVRGRRTNRGAFVVQAQAMGVEAMGIVALLSFLLGLILAFQAAYQLRQFGANIYVANLVAISMVREFGPMMTAIMVAGRSGSAMAAELGTMVVQEEVDALRTMGIDPKAFLLVPRLAAISVVQPALTMLANLVGILGGFVIGWLYLDLSPQAYWAQTLASLGVADVGHGLLKSLVFAWIIGILGSWCGLTLRGGASAVGQATTRAVVWSIFLIIVADSVFTTATTLLGER